jgi:hypothetical protein
MARPRGQFELEAGRLLRLVQDNPAAKSGYYAFLMGKSVPSIQRYLTHLKEAGRIQISVKRYRLGQNWVNRRSITMKEDL